MRAAGIDEREKPYPITESTSALASCRTCADGIRKSLVRDFDHLYVFNSRGNQRTAGEQSRKEGGQDFR